MDTVGTVWIDSHQFESDLFLFLHEGIFLQLCLWLSGTGLISSSIVTPARIPLHHDKEYFGHTSSLWTTSLVRSHMIWQPSRRRSPISRTVPKEQLSQVGSFTPYLKERATWIAFFSSGVMGHCPPGLFFQKHHNSGAHSTALSRKACRSRVQDNFGRCDSAYTRRNRARTPSDGLQPVWYKGVPFPFPFPVYPVRVCPGRYSGLVSRLSAQRIGTLISYACEVKLQTCSQSGLGSDPPMTTQSKGSGTERVISSVSGEQ